MDTPSALPVPAPAPPARRRFSWPRLALVVLLMGGPLAVTASLWVASTGDARALGAASVPLAAVLGGSAHLLLRQRGPRTWGWYGLLLVYLYFGLHGVAAQGEQSRQIKAALVETGQVLNSAPASASGSAALPAASFASGVATPGHPPVRQVFQAFVHRTVALRAAHQSRIEAAGVPRLLQTDFLRQDPQLDQHLAALATARQVQADWAAAQTDNLATLRRAFEALELTPLSRLQGLTAIDAMTLETTRRLQAEEATITALEQILALLRSDRAAWQVQGDSLVFERPDTQAAYNRLLQALQNSAAAAPPVPGR